MSALLLLVAAVLAGPVGISAPEPLPPVVAADGAVPKTVILGFDGMDYGLTRRFMEAGLLPNFQRLSEQGTFQRLDTTNPAQSAVSWAVIQTGERRFYGCFALRKGVVPPEEV